MPESDATEGGLRVGGTLGPWHTRVQPSHHHVLLDRAVRQQVEGLEDEANAAGAQTGPLGLAQLGCVDPLEPIDASRLPVQAAQDVQQRRLSRAGGADY